jgi:hypothetical protein
LFEADSFASDAIEMSLGRFGFCTNNLNNWN